MSDKQIRLRIFLATLPDAVYRIMNIRAKRDHIIRMLAGARSVAIYVFALMFLLIRCSSAAPAFERVHRRGLTGAGLVGAASFTNRAYRPFTQAREIASIGIGHH